MSKKYGEFTCPLCDHVFFEKKKLDGHMGGAHKRNITKDTKPACKFCKVKLIKNKNWPDWAIKQRNLICINCKRKQNRESYRNRIKRKMAVKEKKLTTIKEKLKNVANTCL
jgi:hypothetical protein